MVWSLAHTDIVVLTHTVTGSSPVSCIFFSFRQPFKLFIYIYLLFIFYWLLISITYYFLLNVFFILLFFFIFTFERNSLLFSKLFQFKF